MIQDKQTGISEKMLRRIGQKKKGKIEIRRKYKYQTHYMYIYNCKTSPLCLEHAKKKNIYPFDKKINGITDFTIIKSPVKVSHHHFLKNNSWHHPEPMEK